MFLTLGDEFCSFSFLAKKILTAQKNAHEPKSNPAADVDPHFVTYDTTQPIKISRNEKC